MNNNNDQSLIHVLLFSVLSVHPSPQQLVLFQVCRLRIPQRRHALFQLLPDGHIPPGQVKLTLKCANQNPIYDSCGYFFLTKRQECSPFSLNLSHAWKNATQRHEY